MVLEPLRQELPSECWESSQGPREEQPMLSAIELALQPLTIIF